MIRLFSDIHLDFDRDVLWVPEPLETDSQTVLLLAGDLWSENLAFGDWIRMVAKRFLAVVCVLGNHDYWGGDLDEAPKRAKASVEGIPNVYVLENDVAVIGDTKIVGATLWTDYNAGDPRTLRMAQEYMNDYRRIKRGFRDSRPADMLAKFKESKAWLREHAKRDTPEQKLVVMTHMAPTYESIHAQFRNQYDEASNYFYYSNLGHIVRELEPDFWVHGHTHKPCDYLVGKTRVVCNPRGYERFEDTGYNRMGAL